MLNSCSLRFLAIFVFCHSSSAEVVMNSQWRVGTGENSKEIEVQKNRISREKETIYQTIQEIPSNPKNPWDIEMDYDDTLTPEIPTEQPPDSDKETEPSPVFEYENRAIVSSTATTSQSSSQIGNGSGTEPDLELLAVLLKNPDLVFALTSGQAGNISNEQTVKLLDMIKTNGVGLLGNLNGLAGKTEERVEVSLPSPTPPSSNIQTSGWKPEVVKNPFSKQNSTANMDAYTSGIASSLTAMEMLPTAALTRPPQIPTVNTTPPPQMAANILPLSQQFPVSMPSFSISQTTTFIPEKRPPSISPPVYHSTPIEPMLHSPTPEVGAPVKNFPVTNIPAQNLPVGALSNVNPASSDRTFPMPALSPTPPQPQSQPQQFILPESSFTRPTYHTGQAGNPAPMSDSWRTRQSLASETYSQFNHQNNYSSLGVTVRPSLQQGSSWEKNEYARRGGYEQWSPDNSPTRSPEYMPGWNYSDPGMNFGQNYGPNRGRPGNYSGYRDHGRHGNRRWRGLDHDRRR